MLSISRLSVPSPALLNNPSRTSAGSCFHVFCKLAYLTGYIHLCTDPGASLLNGPLSQSVSPGMGKKWQWCPWSGLPPCPSDGVRGGPPFLPESMPRDTVLRGEPSVVGYI